MRLVEYGDLHRTVWKGWTNERSRSAPTVAMIRSAGRPERSAKWKDDAQRSFLFRRKTCLGDLPEESVGAAIVRRLWRERCEIVLADRSQLDLVRQSEVEGWFRQQKPDVVFMTSEAPNRLADGAAGPASILHGRLAATVNIWPPGRLAWTPWST